MGLVLLVVILEVLIFSIYLRYSWFYPFAIVFLYYGILVTDDSHKTGAKSWTWLRNLGIWRKKVTAVEYSFGKKQALDDCIKENKKKLLFIIVDGNQTNMSLISGFGLHAGVFKDYNICYVLPSILFKIPVLREIIMWTGGISSGTGDINNVILDALNCGKSVCYSLNGMNLKNIEEDPEIPEDLFCFAQNENVDLVPVIIYDEHKRYSIWRHPIQDFFLNLIGFPFPLIFGPKVFGKNRPPKVNIRIGEPMCPNNYKNRLNDFSKLFFIQTTGMV